MKFLILSKIVVLSTFSTYRLTLLIETKKSPKKFSDFQIAIRHHQMALESRKCHHSTQNQKLHRTVSLDFFRKNRPSHFFFV